ncbi:MAG: alpha/beta hydrolase family protein [Pirellulales bacterium]
MAKTLAAEPKSLAGLWSGDLQVGGVKLRLVLHVDLQEDGRLKASLDSPDQGAKGIAIDTVTLDKAGRVRMESKLIKATFDGQLNDAGNEVAGRWKQQGVLELPLTIQRVEKVPEPSRPQQPRPPYPYVEEQVTVENMPAKIKLAGTLTLPKDARDVPAVLLITGSGEQDRDETLLDHKPFLVLADYLTRRGLAVLRLDDRGVGGSNGQLSEATLSDLADDALAAVAFLQARPEINPRQIGLIGHSEGGIVGPLAASRSADVAFVIMLAGPGVPGDEIVVRQVEQVAAAAKLPQEQSRQMVDLQKKIFLLLRTETDNNALEQQLKTLLDEQPQLPGQADPDPELRAKQIDAQARALLSPALRFFLRHDPRPALARLRCPVLAIVGEKDVQVDPLQNMPEIDKALRAAGNADYSIRELEGLNHLFQHCTTGMPDEYGQIEETFAPQALAAVGDWIADRFLPPK